MNKRRPQNCENELVGGFEENPNMEVSCRRNDCFHFSAWNQGVQGLHTKIARILIGTSTSNMINNIPWLKNTRPSKGRALSYSTTPWITPGKDTKSGTDANVPTCCWRGRGLGRDFLLPVLKVGLLSYPATKSYHTANSWTHTANPLCDRLQASDDGFVAGPRSGHRGLWLNRHRGLCQLSRGHRIWHHWRGLWHLLPRHLGRPLAKTDEIFHIYFRIFRFRGDP